jgi:hypothetical protein
MDAQQLLAVAIHYFPVITQFTFHNIFLLTVLQLQTEFAPTTSHSNLPKLLEQIRCPNTRFTVIIVLATSLPTYPDIKGDF